MPDYPTGFTPDATTAAVVPGLTYQPLPGPNGMPRGNFDLGPDIDGTLRINPYGGTGQFFDGATLWNRDGTSDEVKKMLNLGDQTILQASDDLNWRAGYKPYRANLNFPYSYPKFPGTPGNPYGSGAELGLAGAPFAAGYGGAYPGAVNNGMPPQQQWQQQRPPQQQQQQQRPAPPRT
jgi:hypothetical protein